MTKSFALNINAYDGHGTTVEIERTIDRSIVMESTEDESETPTPPWIAAYEQNRQRLIEEATRVQQELDPNDTFDCLPDAERGRLTKALVRFFLMRQGVLPSLPISRDEVLRTFEPARIEANLASTPKLLPYFLQEANKKLAETFGLEIRECVKRIPTEDAKQRKNPKPVSIFYIRSLLPPEMRSLFMEPNEKELQAVLTILIRLVLASDGKLSKSDAVELLTHVNP